MVDPRACSTAMDLLEPTTSSMDSHFQVIILGTGLTESIAAAALAKAGLKVAHIDVNPFYGADEASLTTKELQEYISRSTGNKSIDARISSASLGGELPTASRNYSLSLASSIIPSRGPLISALIGSGVARYGGFKLLESVSVYSQEGFKDVPGSKEEIFKSKELSLIDKRRLMRFLMFASGEFEASPEIQGKENTTFLSFLEEAFSLNSQLASALAYALALCKSSSDPTLPALERIRRYLRSTGRYGPSPFLVGQYGGLGELAQGFCRVCAVSGGTYILGREIIAVENKQGLSSGPNGPHICLRLLDVPEDLTADLLVSSVDYVPHFGLSNDAEKNLASTNESHTYCIALIDGAITQPSSSQPASSEEGPRGEINEDSANSEDENRSRPIDAALLVFPPGELPEGKASGPVDVLINGEGTLSCPRGKSILYLSTMIRTNASDEGPPNSGQLLRPYLDAVLSCLRAPDGSLLKEISSAFYTQTTLSFPPSQLIPLNQRGIIVSRSLPHHIAETGDAAAMNGEALFRDVLRKLGREDAEELEFWPPLPAGLDDDDDVL